MKIKKILQNIFKNIGIIVFKLIYGKVKVDHKSESNPKYLKKEISFDGCKDSYSLFTINNAIVFFS